MLFKGSKRRFNTRLSFKNRIREFEIEDLLGRRAKDVLDPDTADFYKDRTVLITGGGGSIGSELSRQIAKCAPRRLIILDSYENNAFEIQEELVRKYGDSLKLSVEIGSVRDKARVNAIFSLYKPEIVFHAAAHKHVPLMETSGAEAVKNNCFGTYITADAAEIHGAQRFILISSDKALNPTNVMGATKRFCEMLTLCRKDSKTVFSAVRFGNVIGSRGSVVPLFINQIKEGGPLTLTDKRMTRYFMSVSEAVGLVMKAGAEANGGDLFALEMGEPIRIYDLAIDIIKRSGLTPFTDIDIVETGIRPGEKLYEEPLVSTEKMLKTGNAKIYVQTDNTETRASANEKLRLLKDAVKDAEDGARYSAIKTTLEALVPTFKAQE